MESRMEYEQHKIQMSRDGKGQNCVQYKDMGHTYLTCSLESANDIHKDIITSDDGSINFKGAEPHESREIENLLKSFELKVDTVHVGDIASKDSSSDNEDKEPSLAPKYSEWPKKIFDEMLLPHQEPDWPSPMDCSTQVSKPPQWNEYPTVFLSPENKGFK